MEKNILVICDKIQEIKRLRGYFGPDYTVRATNSSDNASDIIGSSEVHLVLYDIGADYEKMFLFYKKIRTDEKTKKLPLIIVANMDTVKMLNNTVKLLNSVVISSTITAENMRRLVASYFPREDDDEEENHTNIR